MANTLYLVGHGRMNPGLPIPIPAGVTIHFAVPRRSNSTGAISGALLRGEPCEISETITGPINHPEHYLCADEFQTNYRKLGWFWAGIQKGVHQNSWLVTPRGPSDLSLSSVLGRLLNVGLSKPLVIYWTCCRSPINEISDAVYHLDNGKLKKHAKKPTEPTDCPGSQNHHHYLGTPDGVLTVVHQSDISALKVDPFFKQVSPMPEAGVANITLSSGGPMVSADDMFGDPRTGSSGDTSLGI